MSNSITGDWDKIQKFCSNFGKDLEKEGKKYISEQSKMVQQTVQDKIKSGEGMKALKPSTIAKKGSNRPLIETGTLLDSISVEINGLSFTVKPTGDNPSGLTNEQQAIYHEFGTERIPPRPFMRPSYEEVEPKLKEEISEVVSNIINRYT